MRFLCLGFMDETRWQTMTERDRQTFMDACFAYDAELAAKGHLAGGEALQGPRTAATLRWSGDRVSVTDGPFAETKEQLGGLIFLEAKDLAEAVELMSKHPSIELGSTWEIRPTTDLSELLAKSKLGSQGK